MARGYDGARPHGAPAGGYAGDMEIARWKRVLVAGAAGMALVLTGAGACGPGGAGGGTSEQGGTGGDSDPEEGSPDEAPATSTSSAPDN